MNFSVGKYKAVCDVCGFEFFNTELSRRWDGFMVCEQDFEVRHPQDLIRSPKPEKTPPWTRPEVTDTFVTGEFGAADSEGTATVTTPFTNGAENL